MRQTAIHIERRAGNEGGIRAGEKGDRGRDLLQPAEAAKRGGGLLSGGEIAVRGIMLVSIGPGCTVLTVIHFCPRSRAQPRV